MACSCQMLHENPLRKTSHDIGHMIDQTTALPKLRAQASPQ
jgi:hypothetical protein